MLMINVALVLGLLHPAVTSYSSLSSIRNTVKFKCKRIFKKTSRKAMKSCEIKRWRFVLMMVMWNDWFWDDWGIEWQMDIGDCSHFRNWKSTWIFSHYYLISNLLFTFDLITFNLTIIQCSCWCPKSNEQSKSRNVWERILYLILYWSSRYKMAAHFLLNLSPKR